jgi:hypothetical protein
MLWQFFQKKIFVTLFVAIFSKKNFCHTFCGNFFKKKFLSQINQQPTTNNQQPTTNCYFEERENTLCDSSFVGMTNKVRF